MNSTSLSCSVSVLLYLASSILQLLINHPGRPCEGGYTNHFIGSNVLKMGCDQGKL